MNIVDHQLQVVAVDVVIEAAYNGRYSVVAFLAGIQMLPLHDCLQLLRQKKITSGDVESVGRKPIEAGRDAVDRARMYALLQELADEIEGAHFQPAIDAPGGSLVCSRQNKRRKRAVAVDQEVQRLRNVGALVVAAVEDVGAQFQK